ncbi:HET-domain-containing protein [Curvularia clavata]|uniref:HET-domain-containing protein n=1 Tax=Curvularia clavata TaxID=95742 RepID=A0A9Q9DUW4_CURCL|nr:HET-domain-containing protein [Curvularia clavata]
MLQYMGTRQPPRKYVVPEPDNITLPPSYPCEICYTRVWVPELFEGIKAAPVDQDRVSIHYPVTSEELRRSVFGECGFCKTIADGVHGKIFLDELYERLERSDSASGSNTSDDIEGSDEATDKQPKDTDSAWTAASAFNEEELENDFTGGWDVWEDRDTLVEACQFKIDLSFERGHAGLFTFLNARIEAVDDVDHPNNLQKLRGEKAVELRYHMNSKGMLDRLAVLEDVLRTRKQGQKTLPISPPWTADCRLGAETNMQMLKAWMGSLEPIPRSSRATANYLPSRLIYVGDENRLRVVHTSTMKEREPEFAALSYVWGTNQSFVLLSTTEELLTTGFEIGQLPKTIQDAITVTSRIELEYIWVDALCIMQDSDEDKAQELPKMRSIYKFAAVTLVASVANSATEGFLHHIEEKYDYFIEPVTIHFPLDMESPTSSQIILSYPADYKRWKDPINSRGWTFQELILSTRAIIFSYRGIQTIDRTSSMGADGSSSGKDPQLPNLPWSGQMFSLATSPENTRQVWLAIRGEYSRRMLSYQGDKLVAVSAIAEELGQLYKGRYLAGMWERDLAVDLQWSCPRTAVMDDDHNRKPRAKEYVAPSWSWASVNGAVEDFVHVWEDEGEDGGIGYKDNLGFEVISCDVELTMPGFEYGAVTSGTLVARGRLSKLIWHPYPDDDYHKNLEYDGYLSGLAESDENDSVHTETEAGDAILDALDPGVYEGVEVSCLAGRLTENVPGRDDVEGIMLLPTTDERYRRIGFFRAKPWVFEKREIEVVTIV